MGHLTLETANVMADAMLPDITTELTTISRKGGRCELVLWSRDVHRSNPICWLDFGNLCFQETGSVSWCQRWQNFRNSPVPLSLFSRHSWNVFILLLSLSNPSVQDSPWFPVVIKQMYVENVQREVDGVLTREHLSDKHWAELKIVPPSHL